MRDSLIDAFVLGRSRPPPSVNSERHGREERPDQPPSDVP